MHYNSVTYTYFCNLQFCNLQFAIYTYIHTYKKHPPFRFDEVDAFLYLKL